jgi:hypothetical protein
MDGTINQALFLGGIMLCFLLGVLLTTAGCAFLAWLTLRRIAGHPEAVQALMVLLRLALLGKEPAEDAAPPAKPEAKAEAMKIKGRLV